MELERMIVFPLSRKLQTRYIVLRNQCKAGLIANVTESSPALLEISTHSFFLLPCQTQRVKVTLHSKALVDPNTNCDLEKHYLLVHCKEVKIDESLPMEENMKAFKRWVLSNRKPNSDLAVAFQVDRTLKYCPLDTIVDLPGNAHFTMPIPQPTYGLYDSDCATVHCVDSDTDTMIPFTRDELMCSITTESQTETAKPYDFGTTTAVHILFMFPLLLSWFSAMMGAIFPAASSTVRSTPESSVKDRSANGRKAETVVDPQSKPVTVVQS